LITHLHIENFKCLRDVAVDLGPFTVLVGANDSGKSALLDAIQVLGRTTQAPLSTSLNPGGLPEPVPFEALVFRGERSRAITWEVTCATPPSAAAAGSVAYRIELRANPRSHTERLTGPDGLSLDINGKTGQDLTFRAGGDELPLRLQEDSTALRSALLQHGSATPSLSDAASALGSIARYRFDPQALRRPAALASRPVLSPSGDNLAAVLDAVLSGPDRSAAFAIDAAIRASIPTLGGLALRTIEREGGRIEKVIELSLAAPNGRAVPIPAAHASEGALLIVALLALAYGSTPDTLLLEAPETGLHPTRMGMVVDLLRKISEGKVGGAPRQVILATHSPILLNYVKPEEVRLMRRDPERGTRIDPMTSVPYVSGLLRGFGVGEVWAKLAEDGLLSPDTPEGSSLG
jgi:predicted ATPase